MEIDDKYKLSWLKNQDLDRVESDIECVDRDAVRGAVAGFSRLRRCHQALGSRPEVVDAQSHAEVFRQGIIVFATWVARSGD